MGVVLEIDDMGLILCFCVIYGRYAQILDDLKKDPESHGGPPDCIVSQF